MEYKIKFNDPLVEVTTIRISIGLDRYVIQESEDHNLQIYKYSDGGIDNIMIQPIETNMIQLIKSPA